MTAPSYFTQFPSQRTLKSPPIRSFRQTYWSRGGIVCNFLSLGRVAIPSEKIDQILRHFPNGTAQCLPLRCWYFRVSMIPLVVRCCFESGLSIWKCCFPQSLSQTTVFRHASPDFSVRASLSTCQKAASSWRESVLIAATHDISDTPLWILIFNS